MNYKMNVTIKDPHTKDMNSFYKFSFTCYFKQHPNTYGNGYYVTIVPDQKEYCSLCYDLRYDKTFNRNNKEQWLEQWAKNYWSGKNGAWVVDTLEIETSRIAPLKQIIGSSGTVL